jgi:hypothetical protein
MRITGTKPNDRRSNTEPFTPRPKIITADDARQAKLNVQAMVRFYRKLTGINPLRVNFHEGQEEEFLAMRGARWDGCLADICRSIANKDAWKIRVGGGNDALILEITNR